MTVCDNKRILYGVKFSHTLEKKLNSGLHIAKAAFPLGGNNKEKSIQNLSKLAFCNPFIVLLVTKPAKTLSQLINY